MLFYRQKLSKTLTPQIKIEDEDNFLQEVAKAKQYLYIYIYMALIEENGKKNHDTKIIRNFVEGLNKVIYEF